MGSVVATTAWCSSFWAPIQKYVNNYWMLFIMFCLFFLLSASCQGPQTCVAKPKTISGSVQPVWEEVQHKNSFAHWGPTGAENGNDPFKWIDIQVSWTDDFYYDSQFVVLKSATDYI